MSSHVICILLGVGCAAVVPVNTAKHWLTTSCPSPYIPNQCEEQSISECSIQVKHHNTHPSHRLGIHRGLLYRRECGARGPTKLVRLHRKCDPQKYTTPRGVTKLVSINGQANLDAIKADKLPPGLVQWPQDA